MANYTRTYLKSRLNAALKNKGGMLVSIDDTVNQAVREVFSETHLRSAKRRVSLSPFLFSDINSYAAPQDLNGVGVIGINPTNTDYQSIIEISLTTPDDFYRQKDYYSMAINDSDSYKRVLLNLPTFNDVSQTAATLDNLTSGGGTWVASGATVENVGVNTVDYVKGSGSVVFDLSSTAGTEAGIVNSGMTSFSFSRFTRGSAFVWAYIPNPDKITNFKLRLGSSNSIYYELTATTTHENTVFQTGWNLLRFDFSGAIATGSPTTTVTYVALLMTKDSTKVSEKGYMFDHIIFKTGMPYIFTYYTQYGWRSSAGAYKLESTADDDVLIANADEFDLILKKAVALGAFEIGEDNIEQRARDDYKDKRDLYLTNNPSEAKLLTSSYYNFDGPGSDWIFNT